jgi:hypothetical protein
MTSVRPATQSDLQSWANMRSKLWPSATEQEHLLELKKSFSQNIFQGWIALDAEKYRLLPEEALLKTTSRATKS